MSSNLPARLQAAVPLLNQPRAGFDPFDPSYREALLEWGLAQIEREYQPDALYRPLDYWRKGAAEREWRKVVAEQGKQQRSVVAAGQTSLAQEAITSIIFEIQERRRVTMLKHDSELRIDEYSSMAEIDTKHTVLRAEALARISAQHQPPPPEDPFTLTQEYQREINRIEADPRLSEEEKHRQTQFWRDALHAALQGQGKSSRG
jgi:hypothetical protein